MFRLYVNKYEVKVFPCDDSNWRHDSVFIYNDSKSITEREISGVIEYLFNEGFIADRRTKYYVCEKKSSK